MSFNLLTFLGLGQAKTLTDRMYGTRYYPSFGCSANVQPGAIPFLLYSRNSRDVWILILSTVVRVTVDNILKLRNTSTPPLSYDLRADNKGKERKEKKGCYLILLIDLLMKKSNQLISSTSGERGKSKHPLEDSFLKTIICVLTIAVAMQVKSKVLVCLMNPCNGSFLVKSSMQAQKTTVFCVMAHHPPDYVMCVSVREYIIAYLQ